MTDLPALIDGAKRALSEARSIDEVVTVRNQANALKRMTKGHASAREAHNRCGEIVIYAERRIGEELKKMEKAKGAAVKGRNNKRGTADVPRSDDAPTLLDIGVSKNEASQAQRIATIPEKKLQEHFDEVKKSGGEITTAGVLRLAKGTAAKEPKRRASKPKKDPVADEDANRSVIADCVNALRLQLMDITDTLSPDERAELFQRLRHLMDEWERISNDRQAERDRAA